MGLKTAYKGTLNGLHLAYLSSKPMRVDYMMGIPIFMVKISSVLPGY
jgi:hypothetical protein